MKITPRFRRELSVLVGGVIILRLVASFCGISESLFATARSSFGGIVLFIACRSLVASIYDRSLAGQNTKPDMMPDEGLPKEKEE